MGERVTQPGMLAVIFSNVQEATEYQRYLTFLRNEGCLEGNLEDLDVEDLPGVPGLRAYRIVITGAMPPAPEVEAELPILADPGV